MLTYGTVCSGIECMSVACRGLPLRPVFFSEIEPFPCAVLKAHYPDVPNLGDMSKISVINKTEITNGTVRIVLDRPIDILAGGTPCQDVSVAGQRAGMREGSGTRSSLAFDFVRLARELGSRYIIWENVAGAIDSKNAPDFLAFLRALGDCGYSLAWRVLDAQYVRVDGMERAVPQRRRRVWVVGYSGADESRAAKILFEPDCVAGHTAPRRRTGEGFAYSLAGCDRVDAPVVDGAPGAGDEGELPVLDMMGGNMSVALHTRQISEQSGQDNRANAVVPFGIGRDVFNSGANASYQPDIRVGVQPTLTARTTRGAVCARLTTKGEE